MNEPTNTGPCIVSAFNRTDYLWVLKYIILGYENLNKIHNEIDFYFKL